MGTAGLWLLVRSLHPSLALNRYLAPQAFSSCPKPSPFVLSPGTSAGSRPWALLSQLPSSLWRPTISFLPPCPFPSGCRSQLLRSNA